MDEADEGREGYRAHGVDAQFPAFRWILRAFYPSASWLLSQTERTLKEVDSNACAFESEHFVHDEWKKEFEGRLRRVA